MQEKNLLIIFTRNPELGKVKTRLAKDIGEEAALDIYTTLLHHTVKVTKNLQVRKSVWYSDRIAISDIWDAQAYDKYLQEGSDLGKRMENAFKSAFAEGYQKVVIIGSDLYDLSTSNLSEAFSQLTDHEVVLGPAKDGGYYLLGMNSLIPSIFSNKNWGNDSVLKDTLEDLKSQKIFFLETLNDIDYVQDLEGYSIFEKYLACKK